MKKSHLWRSRLAWVLGMTGTASAQYYDPGYRDYPRYDDRRTYYRERYRERGDYEE
jgi:hypothetical protein